jgi:hypothetical protein
MSRPKRAPALAGARFVFVQVLIGLNNKSSAALSAGGALAA